MIRKTTKILSFFVSMLFTVNIFAIVTPAEQSSTDKAVKNNLEADLTGYSDYIAPLTDDMIAHKDIAVGVDKVCSKDGINIIFTVEESGLYQFGMEYTVDKEQSSSLEVGLMIDGNLPFSECERLVFPLEWNLSEEVRKDGVGNEFAPETIVSNEPVFNLAADISGWSNDKYLFNLSKGEHTLTLFSSNGSFTVKNIVFSAPEAVDDYSDYDLSREDKTSKEDNIIIEGEDAKSLSEYWLIPRADNTSASVNPNSYGVDKINYIGGSTWKNSGETITWEFDVENAGYYKFGFSYRQSQVINASTYRSLKIDGATPFKQANEIPFGYNTNWKNTTFADEKGNPYYVYLTEGTHEISLTVTSGPIYEVSSLLSDVVSELGDIYMDITMITGDTVDNYRDYDLFDSVENLETRIKECYDNLNLTSDMLDKIGNQGASSYDSSIKSMAQVLLKMLDNKYTAHRYLNDYYSKYCSVASVLNEMLLMPLDLDRIYIVPKNNDIKYSEAGFFRQAWFSIVKFIQSFSADYNKISSSDNENESITVWVNWGRDQAQTLNSLVQSSFTPEYDINVDIKVVNATMVQAVLSGNAPDCILQHSRSEPVNLAMRDVLLDLEQFDDLDTVLERFQEGADIPYRYKDGLYALPDTQNFYLMFYRKDILENLGLEIPETWDEFVTVTKVLARNNLQAWVYYLQITTLTQIDTGVGSLNLFPSMLLQNGLNLYDDDYKKTSLDSSEVIKTFEKWTDFYTKLKVPPTMSFYNRFRTGTCPIGIEPYTTYTTLKATAPEIDGLWGVAPIPGVKNSEGEICHTSTGGGTGCAILKSSKNPEAAWEFLKWWTSEDTQFSYSQNVEAILGPTGRVAVANVNAFKRMSWDTDMKNDIISAWSQVEEIPEVPGSYYVSRMVDLSFWSVVNENLNPKDVLLERSTEVNEEIERKWKQYENR